MSVEAGADDRRMLTAIVVAASGTSRSLAELLRSESALISAGRYDVLAALAREKHALLVSLARQSSALQAAGRDAVLALPEAEALLASVSCLEGATRADMRVLRSVIAAIDRIANIIGQSLADRTRGGYGRGGKAEAPPGGGFALDDRV